MKFYRFILSRKFLFFINIFCIAISIAALSVSMKVAKTFYNNEEKFNDSENSKNLETQEIVTKDTSDTQHEQKEQASSADVEKQDKTYNNEYIELLKQKNHNKAEVKKDNRKSQEKNKTLTVKEEYLKLQKEHLDKPREKTQKNKVEKKKDNNQGSFEVKKFHIQIAAFDSFDKAKLFLKNQKDNKKLKIVSEGEGSKIKYRLFTKKNFKSEKEADIFAKQNYKKNYIVKENSNSKKKRK